MTKFEIKGLYKSGIAGKSWLPFGKVIDSKNEKNAKNKVLSLMGSNHGLKRDSIIIKEVKAVE